jgi:hypothetical protein
MVRREPEEIFDEAHEQITERGVCDRHGQGLGQGVRAGAGGVRVGSAGEQGRDVPARTRAVIELGDHLACQGIQKVTVESTSDCWRIWFYLLEARGLDVQLVNARDVKNVPGRPKTDKLDSVWSAKLTEKGLLRPCSCRRPRSASCGTTPVCGCDLTRERTRHWRRIEKLLEDALICRCSR